MKVLDSLSPAQKTRHRRHLAGTRTGPRTTQPCAGTTYLSRSERRPATRQLPLLPRSSSRTRTVLPCHHRLADTWAYVNASATQAFYTINKFHDILYSLGFDEAAGNFQASNNAKGGREGDPVNIVFHSSACGSALISTPADGASLRLSMGVWAGAGAGEPYRDSAFDSTVLLHEYMHGVTVRLGRGRRPGALPERGLLRLCADAPAGQGWRHAKHGLHYCELGHGQAIGLRSHYISTSLEITPLTLESLNALSSSVGFDLATVWATALYEVFWNLVDTYGIGDVDKVTLGADGVPRGARYLLLGLILDSDALVPCSPDHLQARGAILQADRGLTNGANQCAIWKGFAKRGFGQDAVRGSGPQGRVDGFAVPSGC